MPPGLEEIVYRCLAKEPEERYPEVGALMQDLQVCLGISPEEYHSTTQLSSASLHSHHALPALDPPRRENNSRALLVLALLVLIMLVGSGSWVLSRAMIESAATANANPVEAPPEVPVEGADPSEVAAAEPVDDASPEAIPPEEPPPEEVVVAPPVEVVAAPPPRSNSRPRRTASASKPAPSSEGQGSNSDSTTPPKEDTTDGGSTPDGYMGLPDDF